jgi:hypothetical protein
MLKMFSSCLLATTLILQLGCTQSAPVTPVQGGVDGGGGGTLPAKPIANYEFDQVIATAKRDLGLFTKQGMRNYSRRTSEKSVINTKLYGGSITLWDILQTTDLEVLYDRPCKDANGHPRDGSIHASKPNTICLSAFLISPKTISERAKVEIYSLILHELSHLLGTTEAEAQEYQRDSAFFLAYDTNNQTDGAKFVDQAFETNEQVEHTLFSLKQNFDKLSDEEIAKAASEVSLAYGSAKTAATGVTYSIYSREEEDLVALMYYKSLILDWYTDSVLSAESVGKWQLDTAFENQPTVTTREFQKRVYETVLEDSIYDNEELHRITTKAEAKAATAELLDFSFKIMARLYQFRFGTRPNNLPPLLLQPSPWEKFTGKFKVVSTDCNGTSNRHPTEYEVRKPVWAPNELRLIEYSESGYSDTGGLFDGARVFNASASVFVSGGDGWAERMDEFGDLWAPHGGGHGWAQHRIRFENDPSGEYRAIETIKTRQFMYNEQPNKDSESRCVYKLSLQAK